MLHIVSLWTSLQQDVELASNLYILKTNSRKPGLLEAIITVIEIPQY